MLKDELIANNPLGVFKKAANGNDAPPRMGLVISRPGLGKTAILVQIALDNMLHDRQVMHISVGQNIGKTKSWYDDIMADIATGASQEEIMAVKDEISRNRMIMTFNAATFNRPKLEERLNDLIQQDIFKPVCLVIDGLDFAKIDRRLLEDMRDMQRASKLSIWFSAVIHRETPGEIADLDLFDTVLSLDPDDQGDGKIFLNTIKDSTGCVEEGKIMRLDPTSMVVWG
ncbi:MAG: hypothetical protein GXP59_09870 [Deltaproteobacteria bacterium]|nr:hypothetical protein [Deltaproteobacteria bacterium]